ncbi:pyruvate kinase [Scenedesmus sp. NREL 46B-D3]|nr:pyruvate kinase [Scenedesmus sp. NREL 46B-D3]
MLRTGMSIARFDFSYNDEQLHQTSINNLRKASKATRTLCATMMDTLGPEIVVTNRPSEPIKLEAGQTVLLTCDSSKQASSSVLPIIYPSLAGTGILPGRSVFVGQYLFTGSESTSAYLTVQSVDSSDMSAQCVVQNSCVLEGVQLTVHIGNMKNTAPILSDSDKQALLQFGKPNRIDFVALSFTRSAQDVKDARTYLDKIGMREAKIIAKIENMEGLVNYREIMEQCDVMLLSRGSMGNCVDPEKMFLAQKMLLRECNLAGKPVYVTRVVDTMTDAPRPTRAEATDVANLVLDGADGIVLGSETFRGKFAVACADTVLAICRQAEKCFDSFSYYQSVMDFAGYHSINPDISKTEALATAAVRAATKLQAGLIVVVLPSKDANALPTDTSSSSSSAAGEAAAGAAGVEDPEVVVPRLSTNGLKWHCTGDFVARQCLQYRGVMPLCADPSLGSPDGAILKAALQEASKRGLIRAGDRVVISQCPRVNDRFPVMAEAGVVKILTISQDGVTASNPVVVNDDGMQRCTSMHVFGSNDAVQDCSDLV